MTHYEKVHARRLSAGAPLRQTPSTGNIAVMAAEDGSKSTPTKGSGELPKRFDKMKQFEKKIKNKRTRLVFVVALRKEIIKVLLFVHRVVI